VSGDEEEPPQSYSPEEIAKLTGVALHVQFDFFIIVSKKVALEFLDGLNYSAKKAAFKKKVNGERYRNAFGKEPSRVANRLVFSYLEIMQLEGVNMTLELTASGEEE